MSLVVGAMPNIIELENLITLAPGLSGTASKEVYTDKNMNNYGEIFKIYHILSIIFKIF